MREKNNKNKVTIIAIILITIIVATFFIINNQEEKELDQDQSQIEKEISRESENRIINESNKFLKILDDDYILGQKDAPVKVIEYASLSCPHCAEFYINGFENLKNYVDRGEVVFIYRDFPLNGPALAGSVAALCYFNKVNQGYKYHNFIKNLFKNQEKWVFSPEFIEKLKEISQIYGISDAELTKCIEDKNMQKAIITKAKEASESLEIKSTPTFIINGEVVNGYSGWDALEGVIRRKLGN
jgi:protein-disulfide isomerase